MTPIELAETGKGTTATVILSEEQANLLEESKFVDVTKGHAAGDWTITSKRGWVGSFSIGRHEFRVNPKITISRLLFLISYAKNPDGWLNDQVSVGTAEGVVSAVAQTLWRQVEAALLLGLLHGYREIEDSSMTMRGRLRLGDQLRRRFDQALPMEIHYDDFTSDIAENQLLLEAITRMLEVPGVDNNSRLRLEGLRRKFDNVRPLSRNEAPPTWQPGRLNQRYQPALELAQIILHTRSPEHAPGNLGVNGFMFNLEEVFEDFVARAVGDALRQRMAGSPIPTYEDRLDRGGKIKIELDMVWQVNAQPVVAVDAKYKTKQTNDNLFQMLAYCTALNIHQGHLIYADGPAPLRRYEVRHCSVELYVHALDLTASRQELLGRIDEIADTIVASMSRHEPTR